MKRIMMVASEGLPYIKSGGLADVIGSLPKALQSLGHEVSVVLPLYKKIATQFHHRFTFVKEYSVDVAFQSRIVRIWKEEVESITFYFVEHAGYFERAGLYGYHDDGERFAYFQKAVIELMNQINYFPDILHTHDWHTGMLPALCKEVHSHDARYQKIKHVYTIHNLAYQGNFPREMLWSCLGLGEYTFENGNVRMYDGISFMKSAIVYADKITTVSKTYADEILTPQYGENLEQVLQSRVYDLVGIVNGIDDQVWDTKTDEFIPNHYHKVNVFKQKKENKVALQKELGLDENEDVLLVSMVTRLAWQKGVHLVLNELENLLNRNIQLVIVGNGEKQLEDALNEYATRFRGKMSFYCGYNEGLAHRVYAASDLFLMPSLFEPCGISQLISMRYGTLPLVRETGGLKDTVIPYNQETKEGTGFTFTNYSTFDLMSVFDIAYYTYYERNQDFKQLIRQAMKKDVSWNYSAKEYSSLYETI